jgi:hypothetical protein
MATLLAQCVPEQPWTPADAASWWQQHQGTVVADPRATVTQDVALGATLGYSEIKRPAN